jgi:hypothetical protein
MLPSALRATQAMETPLVDSNEYINVSGPHTRCSEFFLLETKQIGEFEVKEVHVAYEIDSGVATSILYFRDLAVVIDESRETPVLLLKRANPELDKDMIRLSQAAYDEAEACLPAP